MGGGAGGRTQGSPERNQECERKSAARDRSSVHGVTRAHFCVRGEINNSRCRRLRACRQRSTPIHGGPGVQRLQTRRGL
nr:hypothetical protein JVH1_1786 [Rhodococcus sp. JVH1]